MKPERTTIHLRVAMRFPVPKFVRTGYSTSWSPKRASLNFLQSLPSRRAHPSLFERMASVRVPRLGTWRQLTAASSVLIFPGVKEWMDRAMRISQGMRRQPRTTATTPPGGSRVLPRGFIAVRAIRTPASASGCGCVARYTVGVACSARRYTGQMAQPSALAFSPENCAKNHLRTRYTATRALA